MRSSTVHAQDRLGFTVLELLVSLVIIGMLLALGIPALQAVRETGRATECRNRQSQFGRAIGHFEAQYMRLPPAPPGARAHMRIEAGSPHVYLLPYLELKAIYERLSEDGIFTHCTDPRALPVQWSYIDVPFFLCPSDQGERGTNYRFNTGNHVLNYAAEFQGHPIGPMGLLPGTSLADVTDGASNTAILCESLKGKPDQGRFSPEADSWMGGFAEIASEQFTNEFATTLCSQAAATPAPYYPYTGWLWMVSGIDHSLYNHVLAPNSHLINCNDVSSGSNASYRIGSTRGVQKASSLHRGGVNLLLLDGAVRFVNDGIDIPVWQAASTASGGEAAATL